MHSILTNWKTTAIGAGAILLALAHILTNLGSGSPVEMADIMVIWTGIMGFVAKDSNK